METQVRSRIPNKYYSYFALTNNDLLKLYMKVKDKKCPFLNTQLNGR